MLQLLIRLINTNIILVGIGVASTSTLNIH